jgi:hypothetical protein
LCKEGSFASLQYLRSSGISLIELEPPNPPPAAPSHPSLPAQAAGQGRQPVPVP